jgi:hypothetical protein
MSLKISNVSKRLKSKQQWICWLTQMRDGKETKLPVDPNTNQMAKTDDPSTWGSVMDAVRAFQSNKQLKGIGFVFTEDDPFVGIDLDDCRDPESEEWEDWALTILEDVDGFREISPSGTGGHIITIGEIPGDRNRKGSVEMYEHTRYFTVTGDIISKDGERTDEVPDIEESQHGLDAVYNEFLVDEDDNSANETEVDVDLSGLDHFELENHGDGPSGTYTGGANLESLPEEEQKIVKRAKGSQNGYKFTQLWRGNWKDVYPGESHSEADMGFCNMLAFWCSGDPERIDRVFRASGLIRPKWDEQRYSDGSTYGERTIQRAIAKVDDYWDPDHYNELVSGGNDGSGGDDDNDDNDSEESGDGGNEDSAGGEGNADDYSGGQSPSSVDDTESGPESDADQSESNPDPSSGDQDASRRRSRRSRSDSPILPSSNSGGGNGSGDEDNNETESSGGEEEDAGEGENTSANSGSDGDADEHEEGDDNDPTREENTTNSEADGEDSRRRSRGGRNRMADSSEFTPVNVGKSSEGSSSSNSGSNSERDSGGTSAPVNDDGGFYDKEFEDDDWLDEALEDADDENGLDIDRDEAKGIYEDPDDSGGGSEEDAAESDSGSADSTESSFGEGSSDSEDGNTSYDSRTSANGRRKIPGALDAKLHDIVATLDQLTGKVNDLETKHDNEIAQQEDNLQLLRKELAYYEDIVDQQEERIKQLSQVTLLLCRYHPDPFFDQVEQALLNGEKIPTEDIIEAPQQPQGEGAPGGGRSTGRGDWVGESQRSKNRTRRKTSDLDEQEPEADGDGGEDIRDRLSRFF